LKVELEEIDSCIKKISIEVPVERVNEEKKTLFAEIARDASVPGFRKGRAPRKILEQRFGKSILGDAAERLIRSAYLEAVQSNDLHPVGDPLVDDLRIEENEPLSFTATVEVMPALEISGIDGLTFTRRIKKVADARIDALLQDERERHARFEPVEDRSVENGDYPLIDYRAEKDGQALELFQGENRQIHVNKEDMLKDFHVGVIGMKKGEEKTFEGALPKEFPDPELAGATLTFHVKVNEIKRKVVPELDDDFAREVSDYDTLEAYKQMIRDSLEAHNRQMADHSLREEILSALIEKNPFSAPPRLIERNAAALAHRAEQRFAQSGVDMGAAGLDHEKFRDKYVADAIRDIKEQIILSGYARKESIEVSGDDIGAEVARMAGLMGQTPEATRAQLEQSDSLAGLEFKLLMDKVYDAIIGKTEIKDEFIEEDDDRK